MSPLMHRIGAATVVAIGLLGAFSGLVLDGGAEADAATVADPVTTLDPGPRLAADAETLIDTAATPQAAGESVRVGVGRCRGPV
ncbi:MAG: hypothetical protein AAGA90_19985 [Actinomycetota bacterium]